MSPLALQAGEGSLDGSLDPRLGLIAIRLKCWAPDLHSAIFAAVPDIGVNLVENQPRQFSRNVAGDHGGYDVMVTLEGVESPPDAEGEEVGLEATTSEDPIESHEDIVDLIENYSGRRDEQTGRVTFDIELPDGGKNPMHGVSSYLVPGLVWTQKLVRHRFPALLVRALGKIDRPPVGPNGQQPPELDGVRNWLNIRCTAQWRGNVWQITRSWLLSGPGGWNEDMYKYK